MSQAQVLYDLQQIDNEIRAEKQRLGEVLRLQKEPAALLAARERAAAARADLQQWQAQHKDLTLEIASVAEKARRSEERLYSGSVKNPKELADLQNELEALGRRRAALEDDALLMMMEIDERKGILAVADDEVASRAGEFTDAGRIAPRAANPGAASQLATRKRGRHVTLAEPALLKSYDAISRQKNGLAVAGLQANKCLGCRLTLSSAVIRAADQGKLVYCENCGRILCPI